MQCKNGISITLAIVEIELKMKLITSLTAISQHENNNNQSLLNQHFYELNIKINWPNGLQIMATCRNLIAMGIYGKTELEVVEQLWLEKHESGELKRIYYSNGCVGVYYVDGRIKWITSTGMIFETVQWENEQETLKGKFIISMLIKTNTGRLLIFLQGQG